MPRTAACTALARLVPPVAAAPAATVERARAIEGGVARALGAAGAAVCVSCHPLRGVGAHAGHLRLADAGLGGGFALDLELYPPEACRRHGFEQEQVAAEVGATPVGLPPDLARELYELVVRVRERHLAAEPR